MDSTGFALCGIVDERPAAPSVISPISVLLPVATSLAMWPHASQQPTIASPALVMTDRVVCHGGGGR